VRKTASETRKAAQLLGERGGRATLKKYGANKLREWGKRGGKFGKLGGRPQKPWDQLSEAGKRARKRREAEKEEQR
jgi:hypothetical protein